MALKPIKTGVGRNISPFGALDPDTHIQIINLVADTDKAITVPSESIGGVTKSAKWCFIEAELDFWVDNAVIATVNPAAEDTDGTAPIKNLTVVDLSNTTTLHLRSINAQQVNLVFFAE